MRAVSVLEVSEPALWAELATHGVAEDHLGEPLSPTRRVVRPSFETVVLPRLREQGVFVLIRGARRDPAALAREREDLAARIACLPPAARRVLHSAQRHALEDFVLATQAWDPDEDAASVRALYGAGLLVPVEPGDAPATRYHLHPDLPPPPEVAYDFAEAAMDETEDLSEPGASPIGLLHDLASLAAILDDVAPRRTHAGALGRPDARRLGQRLAATDLATDGLVEDHPRWARALRALEALGAVSMDPIDRTLHLDHALEPTLAGDTRDALDRLVHRLVERDLHVVLPAVRAALKAAGHGAVDEMLFFETLREQHRDVLFTPWRRDGALVYPAIEGEGHRPFDDEGFEAVEVPMVHAVLSRCKRLGLIRRAPGVFAGTADGRRWAGVDPGPTPPIWVSGDLEIIVPPDAITPWERFQIERLGRCVGRDVVDRYRMEPEGLRRWLAVHEPHEALDLLRRRAATLPVSVPETLEAWTRSATRFVLVRGVLVDDVSGR